MAFKIPAAQDAFEFRLSPMGEPVAYVEQVGCGLWVSCCPLCGCVHVLFATAAHGDVIDPRCPVKKEQPAAHAAWLKRYPEVAEYASVWLCFEADDPVPVFHEADLLLQV